LHMYRAGFRKLSMDERYIALTEFYNSLIRK